MASAVKTAELIQLKNILYLTDFSQPSKLALPFATALAHTYNATVHALHVLTPIIVEGGVSGIATEAEVLNASRFMGELDSQLAGTNHHTSIENAFTVWEAVDNAVREYSIDLIVIGTHGRTGVARLIIGSVAETIFRRSPCPVMTVGPACRVSTAGQVRRILFATDYSAASAAAAPYAVSLADSNGARLLLVHVAPAIEPRKREQKGELSVAEMIHRLYEIVPDHERLSIRPEVCIEYGSPAERIIAAAEQRFTDLIVLGVRSARGHLHIATHLERRTAHEVVAHACCPVLTMRE